MNKTQHSIFSCLTLALCLMLPQISVAEENANAAVSKQAPQAPMVQAPEEQKSSWLLGVGGSFSSSPYKDYSKWTPIPIIAYNSEHLYIRGTQGGARFAFNEDISVRAFLEYDSTNFFGENSDDKALEQLENRYGSLLVGVGGTFAMSFGGHLHASLATNALNTHSGIVGTLEYSYAWRHQRLLLIPSVGAKFFSSEYVNYYYGVSGSESRLTGLEEYEIENMNIEPYASLRVNYTLTRNISASMGASVHVLSPQIIDSPMVDNHKSVTYSLSGGIVYSF